MGYLVPRGGSDVILREEVEHAEFYEIESLKRACDLAYEKRSKTENYHWIRDRDKLLLTMLWATGARVSDVIEMATHQINFKEKNIRFLVHKRKSKKVKTGGEYWHTINIDMETLSEVMDYIQTWSIKGLLFPSTRKSAKTLTRQAVNKKFNEYCAVAGLRHIHPHMVRHGLAMFMQARGVPAHEIAFRLAHSSTAITLATYARMSKDQEKQILDSLNFNFWKA
jgi:integrase/recombinase XerD